MQQGVQSDQSLSLGDSSRLRIEVCKGTTCDENNDSDWVAFDMWWKGWYR